MVMSSPGNILHRRSLQFMFCVVNVINIYEFAIHITSGTKHDNKFIIFLFKVFLVLFSSLMFLH